MLFDKELVDELFRLLGQDSPPSVLWHYTSAASALEIIRHGVIHLGCHAFMNDPAEGTAAGEVVTQVWRAVVDEYGDHPNVDLKYLRDRAPSLSHFDYRRPDLPPTFLFSLTRLRDSLSQWSRYADNGAGVALGFAVDATGLPARKGRPWSTGVSVTRVDYDGVPPQVASRVRPLLGPLLSAHLPRCESPTQLENALLQLVHLLNPIVKHGAYHEEAEWRLTTRTVRESAELYDIKATRFGLVPYVPLQLGEGIKLVEIMLGPKLPADNEWSLQWLCHKYGISPVLSRSALAYR